MLRLAAAEMSGAEPLEEDERGVIINTASIAAFEGKSDSRPMRVEGWCRGADATGGA